MRVRAKLKGYHGGRRRNPGDIFEVTDPKHFSARWMENKDPEAAPVPDAPPADTVAQDDIGDLRAKYLEAFGKRAFPGWGSDKLKEKLSGKAI